MSVFLAPPVTRLRPLDSLAFTRHFREKYRHPVRKGLFFLRHEGLLPTLRKYRSRMIERRIESEGSLIVAEIVLGDLRFIGLSRRLGERPVFHQDLIFRCADHGGIDAVSLSTRALLALESYLPVPSCPLPPGLVGEILAGNPFLASVPHEPALEAHRLPTTPLNGAAAAYSRPTAPATSDPARRATSRGGVYLLGCGSYVREHVLAHFAAHPMLGLDYRADLMRRHRAAALPLTTSFEDVLERVHGDREPLVIVSTYHADHTPMAAAVLDANPRARVFIEKPPAMHHAEARALALRRQRGEWIDVGFNRRYARFTRTLRGHCQVLPRPLVFTALVKELKLPPTHWYFWPNQGTRITGNVCHWIDLACHVIERPPLEVTLLNSDDTISLAIAFADGSLATILATDHGDDLRGVTEHIEVRARGTTLTIRDYRQLEIRSGDRTQVQRLQRREKGHDAMYRDLRARWTTGAPPRYPVEDLCRVTDLTAAASDMLRTGERSRAVGDDGS